MAHHKTRPEIERVQRKANAVDSPHVVKNRAGAESHMVVDWAIENGATCLNMFQCYDRGKRARYWAFREADMAFAFKMRFG